MAEKGFYLFIYLNKAIIKSKIQAHESMTQILPWFAFEKRPWFTKLGVGLSLIAQKKGVFLFGQAKV